MAKTKFGWRLKCYGDNGALSTEDISELAWKFAFTEEKLLELSRSLGRVLDPTLGRTLPTPIEFTQKSSAYKKAKSRLKSLDKAIGQIQKDYSELTTIYQTFPRPRSGNLVSSLEHKWFFDALYSLDTR